MSRARSIIALVIAAGLAPAAVAKSKAVVIPLKEIGRHPSIELRIDRKGPFRFLVDTGSGAALIVNHDLAVELGLTPTGKRRIGDPNDANALEADTVKIRRIDVGGVVIKDVEAISWEREALGMLDDVPRGIVGLPLFGDRLVTLDYGRNELVVEPGELPAPDGASIIAASFEEGIPSVPIEVAGVSFRAHLDSGSTGFLGLPLTAAERLPLEAPPAPAGRGRTASGDYAVTEARLAGAVRIGGIVIDNPKVRFVGLPQANLGFDLLRSLRVTIDSKNARVRLVSDGTPLAPTERPKLGIMIYGVADGRIPIERVAEGSPAEAAGVKAGDEIVRLNGREVAPMSRYELSLRLQSWPLTLSLLREGRPLEITIGASETSPKP